MERDTAVNQDQTELTFASRIDYLQPAGAYSTTLQFNIVANPPVYYMQDLNLALCTTTPMTVVDKRDNKEYTIAKLPDGNCWMTQNLRYQGDTVGSTSSTTSWVMKSTTSNISTDTTMTMIDLTAGDSYADARYHVATSGQVPSGASYTAEDMGVWYNYAAASAMTITGGSNTNAQVYDICPKGWRLPTNSEQSGITSYASTYSPVAGGRYYNGTLNDTGNGYWWSSTSYSTTFRYYLYWNGSSLNTDGNNRGRGLYVRCVLNDPRTISDITTMQEMSPQIAAKMNNGDTATLKDSRDGQDYTIAKLADGNVWLLENLRLDISDPTVQAKLTSATTNATDTTLGYLKNGGGTSPYPANGVSSVWSSSAQNSYDMPYIATAYKDDITTNYGSGSGKTGIYYNFCAASAGSYCYTSSTGTGNASQDICPLGWQIPTSEEYKTLSGKYNPTATSINSLQYNLSTPLSGYFYNGKTGNYNLASIFWSSTSRGSGGMFDLAYNATSVIPQNYNTRDYGFNIRCIAK